MTGYVSNIQKFSVTDGYGIRTIVFLLGCTLRCKWCQNPETLQPKPILMYAEHLCKGCNRCKDVCPKGGPFTIIDGRLTLDRLQCTNCFKCVENCPYEALKISGKEMTTEEVYSEVMKDKVFYQQSGGGITLSGGEPLVQIDFATEILRLVKEDGIGTCIETAGNVPWFHLEKVLPYTDLFLYDMKLLNTDLHKEWTGSDNKLILSNLNKLNKSDKEIIVRIPLIPNVNDGREFKNIVDYIFTMNSIKEIHILPFHQLGSSKYDQIGLSYSMSDWKEDNKQMIQECESYAKSKGFRVSVGGRGF
ncbi:MAG: glycyl-radical enzyme activating protein [Eubacteriales bacterium]|nr:glycyl-radical enzyme activating protein [Eubacteriales bacterium]